MLELLDHGAVRELRLARPPVNALDPALLVRLNEALGQAEREGVGAVVLSGAPGRFSGGLDVPALLALPRPQIRQAWVALFDLLASLAHAPMPVVAALTGHSPAGGTVLALYADYRVLAAGRYVVGLNEVQVGLPVPPFLYRALTFVVGERQAARLGVAGLLLEADEALRVGLVDELAPVEEVVPRALAFAHDLLTRPRTAMLQTRAHARAPLREAFASVTPALIDGVVEQWFSEETQTTLRKLVSRLGKG
ncbi:MAG: enoyl-CoA hydratase/isomerase family protein [Myxococcales bacterium]|nr:enoyl-CoA hydratase/isomerase family protein [Myxococcales bacterium]